MAKITSFDKTNLKNVRVAINEALASVEKQFGIKLDIGNISFSDNQFTTKLTALAGQAASAATNTDGDRQANSKWVSDFMKYARSLGFSQSDLGREVTIAGRKMKLVGARPRANLPLVVQVNGEFKAYGIEAYKKAMA